ncbi:MAG: hypothetical protein K2J71_03930, partial [Oscillospiraceae bacterium]|nr:hypothetical protein [Oscillospiraceae bacterium]
LVYHKNLSASPKNSGQDQDHTILERAAQRKHMLKKTILWDILLLFLIGIGSTLIWMFSPVLSQIPALHVLTPIRTSVWENLKLLYFPAFFVGLLRYLCMGNLQKGILTTYAEALLLAMSLFTAGHYIIAGILGKFYLLADVIFFYLSMMLLVWYLRTHADRQKKNSLPGFFMLLLLTGCFIYFTFRIPEQIGLFQEITLQWR